MFKKLLVAAGAASVLVTGQVAWAQSQPNILNASYDAVSYTHLTLPTTPYV